MDHTSLTDEQVEAARELGRRLATEYPLTVTEARTVRVIMLRGHDAAHDVNVAAS